MTADEDTHPVPVECVRCGGHLSRHEAPNPPVCDDCSPRAAPPLDRAQFADSDRDPSTVHDNPVDVTDVTDAERAELLQAYLDVTAESDLFTPDGPLLMALDGGGKAPIIRGRCGLDTPEARAFLHTPAEAIEAVRNGAVGFAIYAGKSDHGTGDAVFVDHDDMAVLPEDATGDPTLVVRSGSGRGIHETYRNAGDVQNGKDRDGAGEVRANNWYVVAPGAVHETGGVYHVEHERPVATLTVKEVPPRLRPETDNENALTNPTPSADDHRGEPSTSTSLSDEELITKAKNAKNGETFERLWAGDTSGYPSHSEADLALCGLLAFWTGGDRHRINRLFRRSGLMREKWDRDDYRERTINTVLTGRADFYDPGARTKASGSDGASATASIDTTGDAAAGGFDTLCPTAVEALAGLGEDEDVSALNDRSKAACVWELVPRSDKTHVRVRRDNGELWAYDKRGVWTPEGERVLRHTARQALGGMNYGQNVLAELKAQARSDPAAEVDADTFGLSPGYLAVENGLLDLDAAADGASKDALRDLHPEDYALTRIPSAYDPDAAYDEWQAYVEEWAEPGMADALQEYVGYCLHVGTLPIHRALLLVGGGANGKSTFLHVVRALLGEENTTSIDLQTLANEADALAEFYGVLANIDDDLSARKLGGGKGMFKKLTAGDRVRARRLYEDGFEFTATGKHLYAANEVPDVNVPEDDEAFWRRWLLVEFPNHYPPSARESDLTDRLTEPTTLSGVLNWAIEGRQRLLDQEYFTNEEHYAQAKRERWQAWGDSVDQFISECVEHNPDAPRISTGDAHRRFVKWCRENGEESVGQQQFTNTLKEEDVGYKRSVRVDGTSQRGYTALGFTDEVPTLEDTVGRETQQTSLQ